MEFLAFNVLKSCGFVSLSLKLWCWSVWNSRFEKLGKVFLFPPGCSWVPLWVRSTVELLHLCHLHRAIKMPHEQSSSELCMCRIRGFWWFSSAAFSFLFLQRLCICSSTYTSVSAAQGTPSHASTKDSFWEDSAYLWMNHRITTQRLRRLKIPSPTIYLCWNDWRLLLIP